MKMAHKLCYVASELGDALSPNKRDYRRVLMYSYDEFNENLVEHFSPEVREMYDMKLRHWSSVKPELVLNFELTADDENEAEIEARARAEIDAFERRQSYLDEVEFILKSIAPLTTAEVEQELYEMYKERISNARRAQRRRKIEELKASFFRNNRNRCEDWDGEPVNDIFEEKFVPDWLVPDDDDIPYGDSKPLTW